MSGMAARDMQRCPLCAGLNHVAATGSLRRCRICSLLFDAGDIRTPDPDHYCSGGTTHLFPNWNTWRSKLALPPSPGVATAPGFTPRTVRMLAARHGRQASDVRTSLPLLPGFAGWPFGTRIRATIRPYEPHPATLPHPRLTLGVIAAPSAIDELVELCATAGAIASRIVVAIDSAAPGVAADLRSRIQAQTGRDEQSVVVLAYPLGGDFAAQRNRVQQAAPTDWVLQLDCDEALHPDFARCLPSLLQDAETEGWQAIGLTRRNMVDGVLTALYPDVQFRLLRQSVRFTRPVHEYPRLGSHRAGFVHLGPGLIHTIASRRLAMRENLYEEMQSGAGRPLDTLLLRQRLETGICLPA